MSPADIITTDGVTVHMTHSKWEAIKAQFEALEAALTDVCDAYEDERARIKAGNADRPSVSGQAFLTRARALLGST